MTAWLSIRWQLASRGCLVWETPWSDGRPEWLEGEGAGAVRKVHGYCSQCHCRCGTVAEVDDSGRIVGIVPDRRHPNGGICAIGQALKDLPGRPDRLRQPLLRTRPKGEGDPGFVPISWDEALERAAERLQAIRAQFGPEAVAFLRPTAAGTASQDWAPLYERLAWVFGTPNLLGTQYLCNYGKDGVARPMLGQIFPEPDWGRADLMVLVGHNPANTAARTMRQLRQAQARGAVLAVVDPIRTETARMADLWLNLRPGSDGHLLMGAIRYLVTAGAWEAEFLTAFTDLPALLDSEGRLQRDSAGQILAAGADGTPRPLVWPRPEGMPLALRDPLGQRRTVFDVLWERVAGHDPARVAAETGLAAAAVERFYRLLAATPRTAFFCLNGVEQHFRGPDTARWLVLVMAFRGSLDRPGGNVRPRGLPQVDLSHPAGFGPTRPDVAMRPYFAALDVPVADFVAACLSGRPYRPRALVAFGGSAVLQNPDPRATAAALAGLEFYLRADLFLTPEAQLADLVLPAASFLESPGLKIGFGRLPLRPEGGHVQYRPPVVPPPGQARPDVEILMDLACRLGYREWFWDGQGERWLEARLKPLGLTLAELKARPEGISMPAAVDEGLDRCRRPHDRGWEGFATPLGRVRAYLEEYADWGGDPLPQAPPPLPRDPAFPLYLTSRKSRFYCHAEHRNLPALRRRRPLPVLEVHPDTAAQAGLAAGERVAVVTAAGRLELPVAVTEAVPPGWLVGEAGWWQGLPEEGLPGWDALSDGGANINWLTGPEVRDAVFGGAALRALPCRLEPSGRGGEPSP